MIGLIEYALDSFDCLSIPFSIFAGSYHRSVHRCKPKRTEYPFVLYKWSIVSMPHRSKQDFARLTDEALGTVMAPFPSWGSAKEGPGPKYFYKSLLLICSSLLSRQMCAASSTAHIHKSTSSSSPHIPVHTHTHIHV